MEQPPRHDVTRKRVRYEAPRMNDVSIRRDVAHATETGQTLDLYYPPEWADGRAAPAVIVVSGLSDIGAQRFLGCRINEMESFVSWGKLLAASGLIGITYTTSEDPVADVQGVLRHVTTHAARLGINGGGLGIIAMSSHVPNALGLLITAPSHITCAVLVNGFMLDLDGSSGVAEAQRTWRFVNPAAGKTVDDLPPHVPMFIARAGQDVNSAVNSSIDAFVGRALDQNLPITVVNHHLGPHGFDVEDESKASKRIVSEMLVFLRAQLLPTASALGDN